MTAGKTRSRAGKRAQPKAKGRKPMKQQAMTQRGQVVGAADGKRIDRAALRPQGMHKPLFAVMDDGPQPMGPSGLLGALDELHARINRLESLVDSLVGKLSPVLVPDASQATADLAGQPSLTSVAAVSVMSAYDRIDRQCRDLGRLLDRIEL